MLNIRNHSYWICNRNIHILMAYEFIKESNISLSTISLIHRNKIDLFLKSLKLIFYLFLILFQKKRRLVLPHLSKLGIYFDELYICLIKQLLKQNRIDFINDGFVLNLPIVYRNLLPKNNKNFSIYSWKYQYSLIDKSIKNNLKRNNILIEVVNYPLKAENNKSMNQKLGKNLYIISSRFLSSRSVNKYLNVYYHKFQSIILINHPNKQKNLQISESFKYSVLDNNQLKGDLENYLVKNINNSSIIIGMSNIILFLVTLKETNTIFFDINLILDKKLALKSLDKNIYDQYLIFLKKQVMKNINLRFL